MVGPELFIMIEFGYISQFFSTQVRNKNGSKLENSSRHIDWETLSQIMIIKCLQISMVPYSELT